jgi:hypothetical protein
MERSKIFKCGFDIHDYKDILPSWREYAKDDFIINQDHYQKGDIDLCVWKKYEPVKDEVNSQYYRATELKRILRTGAWIKIKEEIIWLPPAYYTSLQYGKVGEVDLEFRLKRLKHVYEKIRARNNKQCKGTLTIKNRADGETTMSISDAMWEMMDGNMNVGNIGLQSKTRNDAINPCWSTAQILWQSYPQWLKDELYSDFVSGDNIAEKFQFMRSSNEEKGLSARNIRMQYYPCVYNAMDGKHNMKKCILDEICKWIEAEFYDTYTNYSKFIMPGFERRGILDMFSTPADVPTKSNEQVYDLWKDSDTNDMTANGTTKSRVHRIYSNPLDGIQGAYDKYGDADANEIYNWIMAERKAVKKEKLQGEIRAYPLNENEMFDSMDASSIWSNQKGINERKIYLLGKRFKNEETKEPLVVYGNLDWVDGIKDYEPIFRMSDKQEFDVYDARFCFSFLPDLENREPLPNIYNPPNYVENCIGIDSVDKRYAGKRPSDFAMVNHKFLDLRNTGIVKCPTMIYCNRPLPIEISYEDAIKAAIYIRAKVQVESLNTKIVDYFEDRGFINWMLSKIGMPQNSLVKGDAPSGKTAFLDEIISMIDAITNVPVNEGDQYLLLLNYFYQLLDDVSKLNPKDTHARDLSMAWGQALLGCAKLLFKKARVPSMVNNAVFDYLLN